MKYHFSYKTDDDGIWGNCCEVPELYTQADTVDDFKKIAKKPLI